MNKIKKKFRHASIIYMIQKCSVVSDDMYLYEKSVLLGKINVNLVELVFLLYGVSFWLLKT